MTDDADRIARLARGVADRVTDVMLTTPVGQLTAWEVALLEAALAGPHGDEIVERLDRLNRGRSDGTTVAGAATGEGRSAVPAPPPGDATRGSPRRDTSNAIPPTQGATVTTNDHRPQYENRSRLGLATPAIRPGMKGRMLIAGPSGSGKTYTSLLVAMTLREHTDTASVVMIDTEKDSGRTYADEFLLADGSPAYKHISWAAPYNVVDLAMTLRDASGKYDVVIVDSHSHFWRGQGGVLDVAGGRWTGWGEARPMHADMVDAILSCDCHVILCARMTQEHEQERNAATGKVEVRKLGMKIQQDADLEYEMNVALELDMSHTLRVTKSRTRAVPVGKEFIAGHAEEFGGQYREWLKGGEPAASKDQIDNLVSTLNRIEDPANRMQSKQRFVETFGRPEMLLVSRLGEAAEWVANAVLGNEPPPDRAPDAVPAGEVPSESADSTSGSTVSAPQPSNGGSDRPADPAQQGPSDGVAAEPDRAHAGGDGVVVGEMGGGNDYTDENPEDLPDGDVARITAAVTLLTPTKIVQELEAAGLPITGTPKICKARLLDHRLRAAVVDSTR